MAVSRDVGSDERDHQMVRRILLNTDRRQLLQGTEVSRTMKKTFLVLLLLVQCFTFFSYLAITSVHRSQQKERIRQQPMKNILIWNSADRIETAYFNVGSASFVQEKCPVTRCQIFKDHTALPFQQFDAVLMNMLEIYGQKLPEEEGFQRASHQRYVFLTQESTRTTPLDLPRYNNLFNWTMTYKHNSDILLLYGRVKAKPSAPTDPSDIRKMIHQTRYSRRNYLKNKRKSVAWMVSHCNSYSERESYVEELSKYIDVEVIGRCGKSRWTCPRNKHWYSNPECYDILATKHKFYLSFENSLCLDYATEKFFNILAHDIVPVVYGGANYSKLAPPHSYIDAMQYTPKQLARYLNRIGNDELLYNEFFWWKEHYQVEAGPEQMVRNALCDLCEKLHENSSVKVYDDLRTFWRHQCYYVKPWHSYLAWGNDSDSGQSAVIDWTRNNEI